MRSRTSATVVTYGDGGDVVAEEIACDDELRPRFTVRSPWGSAAAALEVRGVHQVGNALAAVAAAVSAGSTLEAAVAGLADAELSPWRMDLRRSRSGVLVLNDAYNANPISMAAALRSLAALPARRRIAVLGTMAELGDVADAEHASVAALAGALGIEVRAVDEPRYGAAAFAMDELDLTEGDAVLLKGSRVAGLERTAARLLER
jgi:UDP-N-acetylmuramoyl-tripeptide--D-alanyl-D-alanine ligase